MLENPQIYLQQNIRFLRKRLELSQEELATKIGLNRGNIASYEKGTAEPKICNLVKFARLFGVNLLDLTGKDLRQNGTSADIQAVENKSFTISNEEQNAIEDQISKAEELQSVVGSLYQCHCFKVKKLDTQDRDTQVLVSHFEQLHEITYDLLKSHKELLDFIRAKDCS